MSSISDRAYFLEDIKSEAMTVSQIKEKYGCADNTARAWVKHPEVERVEGSYPPAYVRKDTLVPIKVTSKAKGNKVVVEFDQPSTEEIDGFFKRVMAGEGGKLDFDKEFRAVDSQSSLLQLMNKLKSCYIVAEYYRQLMIKDGIE